MEAAVVRRLIAQIERQSLFVNTRFIETELLKIERPLGKPVVLSHALDQ